MLRQGGYDGEYGVIRLFTPEELLRHSKVGLLFDFSPAKEDAGDARSQAPPGNAPPTGSACIEHESEPRYQDVPRQSLGTSDQSLGTRQEELRCGESEAVPLGRSWRQGALFPVGSPILEQLDPEQRVAAETVAGPVLIVAGPGTGKTRTLTHRLAHLINDSGVAPENCLALTFSRRAAAEMTERLQRLLTDRADRVEVMTFHGFGLSLLKEYGSRLGLPQSFRVASESERTVVLACSLSISPRAAAQQLGRISQSKRRHVDDEAAEMWHDAPRRDLQRGASHNSAQDDAAFKVYERELLARGWIDFDDLIVLPLRLLESDDDLRASCRSRYRWISVNEYQDIDAEQYEMVRMLVPAEGNLCAIGDPDQAIYGFRGADVGYFQRFCEDYPSARTIVLSRNYRSTQTIVDAALQLIAPASLAAGRHLEATEHGPEQIEIHACATDRAKPSSWSIPSNGWWVARPFSRSTQSAWPRMKENPFPSVILPCSTGRKPRPTCSPRPWPVRECRTSAVRTGVFPSSRSCRRYSRRCPSRLVAGTVPLGGTTLRVVNCVAERRTTRLVSPRTSSAAKMGRSPPAARLADATSIRCSIG